MSRFEGRAGGLVVSLFALCLAGIGACQGPPASRSADVETRASALNLTSLNVALQANGGVATASSTFSSSYPVTAANDGDRKGANWGNGGYGSGWNDATVSSFPDTLQIAFSSSKTIGEIDVFTLQDDYVHAVDPTPTMTFTLSGITAFDVQYWNGTTWVTVPFGSVTGNNLIWRKFTFTPVTTQKVQIKVNNALDRYSRIIEVEAYTSTFAITDLNYFGSMAIGDLNGDGCPEVLGTQSDCQGHLLRRTEADVGLGALRAVSTNGMGQTIKRAYRDARLADLNGDGKLDLIANTYRYAPDSFDTNFDPSLDNILIFFGAGDGTFTSGGEYDTDWRNPDCVTRFAPLGETIVVADFDNDGDLDVFLPVEDVPASSCTTDPSHQRRNLLLENDGTGHFLEIADLAGVTDRTVQSGDRQAEGAQAIDVDRDGKLDIGVSSHIWINTGTVNGHATFQDRGATYQLPVMFDEGIKFYDWNNDGNVDFIRWNTLEAPHLYQFNGTTFSEVTTPNLFQSRTYTGSASGINVEDLDGDGFMDVFVAGSWGGPVMNPTLFLYQPGGYVLTDLGLDQLGSPGLGDVAGFADFDRNGAIDMIVRAGPATTADPNKPEQYAPMPNMHYLKNNSVPVSPSIRVLMLDQNGRQNQQGRRVTAVAQDGSNFAQTRFIDGGSGYLTNGEYALTFPTPRGSSNSYQINAYYAGTTVSGSATAGSTVKIYSDGRFVIDASGSPDKGLNLAAGSTVTVSSDVTPDFGWSKARAADGNRSSFNNNFGWSSSSSLTTNHTEWIRLAFAGTVANVGEVDLYPRNDSGMVGRGFPVDFQIQTSVDSATCSNTGSVWTQVYGQTGTANPGNVVQRIHFTPTSAACVRVVGTNLSQVENNWYRMQFAEVEVFVDQTVSKTVTATSEIGGWPATNAVNGNENSTGGNWSSTSHAGANSTESITVDLGATKILSHVDLVPRNNAGFAGFCFPVDFTIQTSPTNTAGSWTTVVTRTSFPNPGGTIQSFPFFTTILGRYVKVEATKLSSDGTSYRFQLAELEAY